MGQMNGRNFTPGKRLQISPVRYLIQPIAVLAGLFLYFGLIQSVANRISGNDSYFNIKYAWLLWHDGAVWNFPWLQGTIFRDAWVDHQFLFHVLLIPFTWIGDLYLAAKVAGAFWATAAVYSVYLVIRRMGGDGSPWRRWAWIWPLVIVASSNTMLYRLSNTRVQAVSAVFMMAAIALQEKGHYRSLLPLGFLFAWLYHGSVILIPLTILYALSCLIIEKRLVWKPIAYACAGLTLGFLINPYFPDSLRFLVRHLPDVAGNGTGVPPSAEWVSYASWDLFQTTRGAWLLLLLGILIMTFYRLGLTRRTLFHFLACCMMLVLFLRARRFVEYWPLFVTLFSASVIHEASGVAMSSIKRLANPAEIQERRLRWFAFLSGLFVVLIAASVVNAVRTGREISQNAPADRFADASSWLKANTPWHSVVYNSQWDAFPDLFFHNHHNLWVAGLNANFTYFLEPRLWLLYKNVSEGVVEDTARYLKQSYHADYALTLKKEGGLVRLADRPENGLVPVWEDRQTAIYRLQPSDRYLQMEAELHPQNKDTGEASTCQVVEISECQDFGKPSAHAFLQCKSVGDRAKLAWTVDIPSSGLWFVEGRFPSVESEGKAAVSVNGQRLDGMIDLQRGPLSVGQWKNLGKIMLKKGSTRIDVFYEMSEKSNTQTFGLDVLRFTRVGEDLSGLIDNTLSK
jgi:hypothetical protein